MRPIKYLAPLAFVALLVAPKIDMRTGRAEFDKFKFAVEKIQTVSVCQNNSNSAQVPELKSKNPRILTEDPFDSLFKTVLFLAFAGASLKIIGYGFEFTEKFRKHTDR